VTGSTLAIALIVVAAVIGLLAMLIPVLLADKHPYFENSRQDQVPIKVRGGIHVGDPRSQGPPQGEEVLPPRQ
jgi:hypothetical protein